MTAAIVFHNVLYALLLVSL